MLHFRSITDSDLLYTNIKFHYQTKRKLKYLNQQDRYVCFVNDHVLATESDNKGFIQILCHNVKKPGYRYYMKDFQAEITDEDLFDDNEPLHFQFRLHGLPKGTYLLKIRSVSDTSGSAFTGYKNLQYPDESRLGRGEMEYFRAASVPVMTSHVYEVGSDGELTVDCTLTGNEFRHLHLMRSADKNPQSFLDAQDDLN